MKQYFFLVTELVNGKLTPLKITLQSHNAVKFGRTYAEKHPNSLISLYKQPISNSGKVAVILQYPSSSVAQAMHTKPTIKVYYPKHVEKSFHDYDETGKYMYAAKVDDTFWFFEERISGMPASFGGINTSFGMDMTMPFLEQQNWEEYDMSDLDEDEEE